MNEVAPMQEDEGCILPGRLICSCMSVDSYSTSTSSTSTGSTTAVTTTIAAPSLDEMLDFLNLVSGMM